MIMGSNFKSLFQQLSPKKMHLLKENPAFIMNKIYDFVKI